MNSLAVGSVVFACVCVGTLIGMFLRVRLPNHHLTSESKDVVKGGAGLIATMAALVLGLLIASAKSSYDAQKSAFALMSAKVALLDKGLAHYGPEAKEARELLRVVVARILSGIAPEEKSGSAQLDPRTASADAVYDEIQELAPKTDAQRSLQTQALAVSVDIAHTRWLLFQQSGSSIPTPFLAIVVFWLAIIFGTLGLFAPINGTTISTLLLCALSVSGAIFLIFELDHPFDGIIRISSAPMRNALEQLLQ